MPDVPTPGKQESCKPQFWCLESETCSLWFLNDGRGSIPQIVWFGPSALKQADEGQFAELLMDLTARPVPPATLDSPPVLTLFPEASSGTMANPALIGHRGGEAFAPSFKLTDTEQNLHKLTFQLQDPSAGLSLLISVELDPDSGVVTFQTSLKNTLDTHYQLDWLASGTLPIKATMAELVSFHGRWGLEMQEYRQSVLAARIQIENLSGRTSHLHFPGVIAGAAGFNSQHGQLIGLHLAWSGSHRTVSEALRDGATYIQSGAALLPGEVSLAAGETYRTPKLHVVAANGTNQMSQRFHEFVRRRILPDWTRITRPIHANSWEAVYFNHQTETLMALVDAAAANGAERFVLDDGWFLGRRDDTAGLGDWFVDKEVYPEGLKPLVDRVRDQGMQFGLWFEPEMLNPKSNLYRNHPEWVLHVENYETPLARNQLVLNVALQEVQQYLFDCIANLVHEYRVDYIKWDMNRDLVIPGNGLKAVAAAQPEACYALMDRLLKRFPDLEMETCSSGGARTDMAVLQRTGRVWTSDSIDPLDRASIQRSFLTFLPPEIMGAHVGSDIAHLTGRHTSLHTRAIIALQGQYGFELDARKINDTERGMLAHYTALYKTHRGWLCESSHWRIETGSDWHRTDNPLLISGQVSEDARRSLWFVVMQQSTARAAPGQLVLAGLNPGFGYDVTLASLNRDELLKHAIALPRWIDDNAGVNVSGEILMSLGLQLPVLMAGQALLVSCMANVEPVATTVAGTHSQV